MCTVIIPAHNEASVIEKCLDSVVNQESVDNIIVSCNACTDNTVDLVKNYGMVRCLESQKASKTNAINAAEKHITSYPVFYIDADTCLGSGAVQEIIRTMDHDGLLLAAPAPNIIVKNSTWMVRAFYRVWLNLPYIKEGVIATCSYVISKEGRERFALFPEIISDDGFVRGHFKSSELANVATAEIFINAPKDLFSLVRIKTRARLGNLQLKELSICPVLHGGKYKSVSFREWLKFNPVDLLLYFSIQFIIRIRAKGQFRNINKYEWERDSSTRE